MPVIRSTCKKTGLPVLGVAASVLLTACGGGGGGGETVRPDSNHFVPPKNPDQVTIEDGEDVLVAVTDTGIRETHDEFQGRITQTHTVVESGDGDTSDAHGHGTAVASLVAGRNVGYSGNARLMAVKMTRGDTKSGNYDDLFKAVGYAAENGARVINTSFIGWEAIEEDMLPHLEKIEQNEAAWVVGAGNGDQSLSESPHPLADAMEGIYTDSSTIFDHEFEDNTLIVGALNPEETDKADFSNYPGHIEKVQDRFLVAPGDEMQTASNDADSGQNAYQTAWGTSFAAPVVSAAAATLMSQWPHLNGEDVAGILLDSADRSFSDLYERNNCGPDGNQNCGLFYFGQGRLDLQAALEPQGEPQVATAQSVDGASAPLRETTLVASPAFGDALGQMQGMDQVAVFDAYGRDYRADLNTRITSSAVLSHDHSLNRLMARSAAPNGGGTFSFEQEGLSGFMRYAEGGVAATHLRQSFAGGALEANVYHFTEGEADPYHGPASLRDLPMLGFSGAPGLAGSADQITGAAMAVPLDRNLSLQVDHWRDTGTSSHLEGRDAGLDLSRSEVALGYQVGTMHLSAGMAQSIEQGSLLGSRGRGAFALEDEHVLQAVVLRAEWHPNRHMGAFARFEQGQGQMDARGSLITEIDGIRTEQMALGLTWMDERTRAGLVASQPLRVEQATARYSLPVGRAEDGGVMRRSLETDVAPSGQQRNLEFALSRQVADHAQLGLNVLHVSEPGHMAGADSETLGAVRYERQF